MSQVTVSLNQVEKTYTGGKVALSDVNLSLEAGRFVALIGPNGAGKSTFINLVCGVLQPTRGEVKLHTARHADIGWCSQMQMVDWYLSVRDNIAMGARFAGLSTGEAHAATNAILTLLDMDSFADKKCDFLSGGQLQRVQIARAMVHRPQVLILDEPTVGLDIEVCDRLLVELKARAHGGATVVVSSHDLDFLERFCDDILFINEGRVLAFEPKQAFMKRFAATDLITIEYAGDLGPEALEELHPLVLAMDDVRPLQVHLPRGQDLAALMKSLTRSVDIIDVQRTAQGLREAYLNIKTTEGAAK